MQFGEHKGVQEGWDLSLAFHTHHNACVARLPSCVTTPTLGALMAGWFSKGALRTVGNLGQARPQAKPKGALASEN